MTTASVRLTARFLTFFSGGQLYQTPDDLTAHGYGEPGRRLVRQLAGPCRKDGSVTVKIDADQAEVLRSYAAAMEAGGADNTWDADGRADLASARALLGHLDRHPG